MMSVFATDIRWMNEGDDGFELLADPQAGRNLINAAISMWEKVIQDFDPLDNTALNQFDLTFQIDSLDPGKLGGSALDSIDGDGKPRAGTIKLDDDAAGGAWFLDPTPFENSEFDTLINSFAATATSGPASMGTDLFSVALHEIGHLMGIKSDTDLKIWTSGFLTDTGQVDPSDNVTTLYEANSPFNPTLGNTPSGGLHVYGGTAVGGLPTQPNDLMNPALPGATRRLISNLDSSILGFAYGYNMEAPSHLLNGSFLINLDSDGVLTLNGDPNGVLGDDFQISRNGADLTVSVNTTQVSMPFNQVQSIQVNALGGDDDIYVEFFGGDPIPLGTITVNGGGGQDLLSLNSGTANGDGYALLGDAILMGGSVDGIIGHQQIEKLTIDAGGGNDEITVSDAAALGDATELWIRAEGGQDIVNLSLHSSLDEVHVEGDEDQDHINIERVTAATDLTVFGGLGNDFLYVSQDDHNLDNVAGEISIFGSENEDTLSVYDDQDNSDNAYLLQPGVIRRNEKNLAIYYGGDNPGAMEHVYVFTSQGNNQIDVTGTNSMTEVLVEAGAGNDTFRVDSSSGPSGVVNEVKSKLTLLAGQGNDTLALEDSGDGTADVMTVTDTTIGAASGDSFFGPGGGLHYGGFTHVDIRMGRPTDEIKVTSTAYGTDVTIYGNLGNDNFYVSSFDGPDKRTGNSDGIRSHLVLEGNDGGDHLVVDDSTDTTGDRVTITDTEIGAQAGDNFFGVGGHVTYKSFATLGLLAGKGDDFVNLRATAAGTATTLKGGDGADKMTVDSNGDQDGGVADGVVSSLVLQGLGGSDTLVIEDSTDVTADKATLTGTQLGAAAGDNLFGLLGSLGYSTAETLIVNGGDGGNTFHVLATTVGTATEINAGDGADVVKVDSNPLAAGGTVDDIRSSLSIRGQGGVDALFVDDASDGTGDQFSLQAGQLGAPAGETLFGVGGSLPFTEIESLQLDLGSGGDLVLIRATSAPTTLNTGVGNDSVAVDSNGNAPGGDVNGVLHPLTVNGGVGTNTLRLLDSGDDAGAEVTVTPSQVGAAAGDTFFGLGGSVGYSAITTLAITTGAGDDRFHIEGTNPGTSTSIVAGDGDNGFFIDSNGGAAGGTVDQVRSLLQFEAGVGTSTLWMEDSSDTSADNLHLQPTGARDGTVGLGDNYFGAGGSVKYARLAAIHAQMGNVSGDTIFAAPSPSLDGTQFVIDGNDPNSIPGDSLVVDLSGVGSPVHLLGDPGAGQFLASDHALISYREIESVSTLGPAPVVQLLGDTNGDSAVDLDDLNNVRNSFGETGRDAVGDTDMDGDVDLDDLNNVRNAFGNSLGRGASPEAMSNDAPRLGLPVRDGLADGALHAEIVDLLFDRFTTSTSKRSRA